jgi:replication factor C subunit 1
MEAVNINSIFERESISKQIKNILLNFDENSKNINYKKGIYIYGSPGCGKTQFVTNILNELNYDVIKYDAGDVRNKALIDTITSNNVSNRNVLQMMTKQVKKIAIVMDEIDGMNNGDKGGITALIKIIRQKKTKKQKLENMSMNPIICIVNYYIDKKIKELMKVCNIFEIKTPTTKQMKTVILSMIPKLKNESARYVDILMNYIQGDMRKLSFVYEMLSKKIDLINEDTLNTIFHRKSYNEDSKKITQQLIMNDVKLKDNASVMNETDRTIVALLWHENIVDAFANHPIQKTIPFYSTILDNICFADYMDRITFQNQIWQFNEMTYLIKTFYNNKLYHENFKENKYIPTEIRFTKVLTKYSTEYNNMLFIFNLCQELDMDKRDVISLFQELRIFTKDDMNQTDLLNEFDKIFENYKITKLDVKRMYRYLDKNIKKEVDVIGEDDDEDE